MMVLVVVPGEEPLTKGARILDGAESVRELGAILQGAKMTLRIWIVVGDVRPRVGLGDAEIGQKEGHGLGPHRRAPIGVNSKLAVGDSEPTAGVCDEALGEFGAFAIGQHPADDIAAEDARIT